MGTIKTKGIIISENVSSDYDKMLTMLTPGLGKISVSAKGARRHKSALLAGSQFLCFGDYMLYKGSDIYNINSCETIEVFYNIRTDLEKLELAADITKIIMKVTTENQNSYKILQLYLNTLYIISETDKNKKLILAIFKMRLLKILGFTPKIEKCVNCGTSENIKVFSIKDNGFKCLSCSKQDTSSITMSQTTKNAVQYAILAESKRLYSFEISEESINELSIIAKIYMNEKLELFI